MSTEEKAVKPSHEAWIQFLAEHPTRGGIAEALIFQAGWQGCAEKSEAVNKELLQALEAVLGMDTECEGLSNGTVAEVLVRDLTGEKLVNKARAAIAKARGIR